jgi:hypothetical protein
VMNEYMSSPFCVWDLLYSDLMGPPPGVKTNKFKKSNEYDQNSRRQVEYDMLKIGMRRCGDFAQKSPPWRDRGPAQAQGLLGNRRTSRPTRRRRPSN